MLKLQFSCRDWMWLCVVIGVVLVEARSSNDRQRIGGTLERLDAQCDSLRTCYSHAMTRIRKVEDELDDPGNTLEKEQLRNLVGYLLEQDRKFNGRTKNNVD